MEIKFFAEQLLYGNALSDKLLVPPVTLTDLQPGSLTETPKYPGRPDALRLDRWNSQKKVPFPSLDKLSDPQARGQILHFFANHELLAIELMALVLLKFPEAPSTFRRGIVQTIFEEQEHMRLYATHMKAMGVEFGEIPVNDFFWTCLSPMTSLLDFVAHMSLTFEQANLDFSLHYAKAFRKIGDQVGANLLDQVFKDEIGHVKNGLVWLNRWKDVHETDWDAYVRSLRFPITPNRAKGLSFVADLRRDIGFSNEFISELSVFTHTKGRPPDVYVYNPNVEAQLAGHGFSVAEQNVAAAIESDLGSLMMFLGKHDDLILVRKKPSSGFLMDLKKVGIAVPEFATYKLPEKESGLLIDFSFEHKNLGNFFPWAASDDLVLAYAKTPGVTQIAVASCESHVFKNQWFSKSYRHDLCPETDLQCHSQKTTSLENSLKAVNQFLSNATRVVVKAPYSSSGRHRLLVESSNDPALKPWLTKTLSKQHAVVVEPWLDKVCDLSLQLYVRSDAQVSIDVIGWTRFLTDSRGQYLGTVLGRPLEGLETEFKKMFYQNGPNSLESWRQKALAVAKVYAEDGYRGPLGIDSFVYRSGQGLCLRPIVEVNTRFTMGRIALEISKWVLPAQFAVWMLIRVQDILKKFSSLDEFCVFVKNRWPVQLQGQHIRQGVLLTSDARQAILFVSLLCVGREVFDDMNVTTGLNEKHCKR